MAGEPPRSLNTSLVSYQASVDQLIRDSGGYWPALANLARLFEECGELARAINLRDGQKRLKPGEARIEIEDELGDVFFVTIVLANSLHIDADAALGRAIEKVRQRVQDSRRANPSIEEQTDKTKAD